MISNRINELVPCTDNEEVIRRFERFTEQELPLFQGLISHTIDGILDINTIRLLWYRYDLSHHPIMRVVRKAIRIGVLTKISKGIYQVDTDLARDIIVLKFYQEETK